jgi:hypothetical protein
MRFLKRLLPFILSISLALDGLSQQYIISANITGFPDSTKFYLKDLDTDTDIDSALVMHHSFSMKGRLGVRPKAYGFAATTTTISIMRSS